MVAVDPRNLIIINVQYLIKNNCIGRITGHEFTDPRNCDFHFNNHEYVWHAPIARDVSIQEVGFLYENCIW